MRASNAAKPSPPKTLNLKGRESQRLESLSESPSPHIPATGTTPHSSYLHPTCNKLAKAKNCILELRWRTWWVREDTTIAYMDLLISQDFQQWISWSGIWGAPDESIHTQLSSRVPPTLALLLGNFIHPYPLLWDEQNRGSTKRNNLSAHISCLTFSFRPPLELRLR